MNADDYEKMLLSILSDTTKFQSILGTKDQTDAIEKQLASRLKELREQNLVTSKEFNQLKPIGSRIQRLHRLPKVHEQRAPLRPILDMTGSPNHEITKWLAGKLKPSRDRVTDYCIKDTYDFVDRMKESNVFDL